MERGTRLAVVAKEGLLVSEGFEWVFVVLVIASLTSHMCVCSIFKK